MTYTAENVLELIMVKAEQMLVIGGTRIGVILETNFPPLVVPDAEGKWVLTKWGKHGIGAWKLEYTYRVETYCLTVKTQDGNTVTIEGFETTSHDYASAKMAALNAAFGSHCTFVVGVCE